MAAPSFLLSPHAACPGPHSGHLSGVMWPQPCTTRLPRSGRRSTPSRVCGAGAGPRCSSPAEGRVVTGSAGAHCRPGSLWCLCEHPQVWAGWWECGQGGAGREMRAGSTLGSRRQGRNGRLAPFAAMPGWGQDCFHAQQCPDPPQLPPLHPCSGTRSLAMFWAVFWKQHAPTLLPYPQPFPCFSSAQ